jgi:hypothetical protein
MNSVGGQRREDSANQLAPNSAPGADQIADYKISNSDINQMFTLKNNLADSRPRQQQQSAALQAVVGKRFTLHPESTVEEFKSFRQSMLHPATVLAIDLNMNNRPSEMAQNPAQAAAMANAFSALCDELLTHVAEIHTSVSELGVWKNEFINQPLPSSVKLNFTAMYSKLFRWYTIL